MPSATPEAIEDRKIAVVAGSRHEAFLKTFYPRAELVAFETPALARNALKTGKVAAHFGDAISLSFWLNGAEAASCCASRTAPSPTRAISARASALPSRRAMSRCGARSTMRWPGSTGAALFGRALSEIFSRRARFRPLAA